jgi:hypothetical protein
VFTPDASSDLLESVQPMRNISAAVGVKAQHGAVYV